MNDENTNDQEQEVQTIVEDQNTQSEQVQESNEDENLIIKLKEQYEKQMLEQAEKFKKQLEAKDQVILQLLKPSENTASTSSYVDEINKKRIFKKW